MNWEMISAIGQMLGAIGMIISIVVSRTWMPSRSCGSARIWGVSCGLPTAFI